MSPEAIRFYALARIAFAGMTEVRLRTDEQSGQIRLHAREDFDAVTVINRYDGRGALADQWRTLPPNAWEGRLEIAPEFMTDGVLADQLVADACRDLAEKHRADTDTLHPVQRKRRRNETRHHDERNT